MYTGRDYFVGILICLAVLFGTWIFTRIVSSAIYKSKQDYLKNLMSSKKEDTDEE